MILILVGMSGEKIVNRIEQHPQQTCLTHRSLEERQTGRWINKPSKLHDGMFLFYKIK